MQTNSKTIKKNSREKTLKVDKIVAENPAKPSTEIDQTPKSYNLDKVMKNVDIAAFVKKPDNNPPKKGIEDKQPDDTSVADQEVVTNDIDCKVERDYPQENDDPFQWEKSASVRLQTAALCRRLCDTDKLFRTPSGDILWLEIGKDLGLLDSPIKLEGFIRSHFDVEVYNKGKISGNSIPANDLRVLLSTAALQNELPVVDSVTNVVTYNSDWALTQPGYNKGPAGESYFYTGESVVPEREPLRIRQFIGSMSCEDAGRTNAVALALTGLLRFMWQGKKPFGAVTSNKSHAGKDTVVDFASGRTGRVEVSWQHADWALQNETVAALFDINIGILTIGNIRIGSGAIESAFIERIVTAPKSIMQSSKRKGDGYGRNGDFVVLATANMGRFSTDLANRSLPIHLELHGDIADRKSEIGDPRHEFLPANMERIEAELCGLIENWKDAGRPLDNDVKHPMKEWARTIGGILKVNGFEDFLGNWQFQRSVNDTVRESLAIVANASKPDVWLRIRTIRETAEQEGVIKQLLESRHRESESAMERQLGKLLSSHRDETIHLSTDEGVRSFKIRKTRNEKTGQMATVYRFQPVFAEATE